MKYRGFPVRIGGPTRRGSGKVVQVWSADDSEVIHRAISVPHAERWIDNLLDEAGPRALLEPEGDKTP